MKNNNGQLFFSGIVYIFCAVAKMVEHTCYMWFLNKDGC